MAVQGKSTAQVFLVTALLTVTVLAAHGAGGEQRSDFADRNKRRLQREQRFLYRAAEELSKSRGYVNDAMLIIDMLVDSEYQRKYRDWHHAYANWLKNNAGNIDADLSRSYAEKPARSVFPDRFENMTNGYTALSAQLAEQIARMEEGRLHLAKRMDGLKAALGKNDALRTEKEKERKQRQPDYSIRDDDRRANQADLTDAEVAQVLLEINSLIEHQNQISVLLEMARGELSWIALKAGDSAALTGLAGALASDTTALIAGSSSHMISTYESDIVYLKKEMESMERKRAAIPRQGPLKTLDRVDGLTAWHDQMKSRYEHHIVWLSEQIGAYRADRMEVEMGQ